jgi:hypothetical protein
MQLETLTYSRSKGWCPAPPPHLDSDRTLVLVFGARGYSAADAPIRELCAAYPRSRIVGCSTAGEIFGTALSDDTLSVAVARFESSDIETATAAVTGPAESFEAGAKLAQMLDDDDLRSILVLSDGLNVNGSELVRGLNANLESSVVVTGGLAADGDRFRDTWVLDRDGETSQRVCAVGFYGDRLRVGHGSKGGWDIFGPERLVTRSKGNVLFELDGQPALALYKRYLGDRAAGLPATALLFPLALRASRDDPKTLVRTVLAVDEEAQSMTFAGDVPEGHRAKLMRANFDRLIGGASEAALNARKSAGSSQGDTLAIAISCVGRRLILGERTEEELEAALNDLPEGTRQIGFYSYGEISPYASGYCDLHNQTMTLTTIRED